MQELTFRGYLSQYVKQLSKSNTTNLAALVSESNFENPRLREPLTLYVLYTDKQDVFFKHNAVSPSFDTHKSFLREYSPDEMTKLLSDCSPLLPEAYHKVWRSYQSQKNRFQADTHTKELMRNKILRLQKAKKVSNYRIYTDLKLNPGNINSWLKNGANEKVSLDNARKVLHYIENANTNN